MSAKKQPKIAICGRPNVGKSTLFNRLSRSKKSLVLNKPGVTRDVYRNTIDVNGIELELADLAGLDLSQKKNIFIKAALEYLKQTDLVLFLIDARSGILPDDEELARQIRHLNKKVLLVLSKSEGRVGELVSAEASGLGWGNGLAISAEHNLGIETLKEEILQSLISDKVIEKKTKLENTTVSPKPICFGVYGRPNVGKSTLVNYLLGENRMLTSSIPGTTVDSIDTDFEHENMQYRIIDTAGIRKKSKTTQGVEVLSVVQTLKSLEQVDIALFLIDGFTGITDQDEKIAGILTQSGKSIVLIVNKWDLCQISKKSYAEKLRQKLSFLDFAPLLFVSALNHQGIDALWNLIVEILQSRNQSVSTSNLNRFFKAIKDHNNPTKIKIYYAIQISKNPPTIVCMVNKPRKVHFSYERYLKNELRNKYGWVGSPVRLLFRATTST